MHNFYALFPYFLTLEYNKYTQNILNINILKIDKQTLIILRAGQFCALQTDPEALNRKHEAMLKTMPHAV
jgi:hypothetical protein